MLKIVQSPDPVLSQKAKEIATIDKSVHNLLKQMAETLVNAKDPEGVGLAAPQVGKSLQLFIIKQTPRSPILTFINPVIEKVVDHPKTKKEQKDADEKGVQLEGCLSIHNVWGVVKRHDEVVLSYQDETGKQHKRTFDGFLAVIIQHEYDHLQGILFPKRVLEQDNPLYKAVKNKDGETEFEEIEL